MGAPHGGEEVRREEVAIKLIHHHFGLSRELELED